ncbi:MAG: acetate--CoA ligase family protein [bacterium]|nr:acetate--CoA ligase family protein [bacterium]
MDLLPLLEPKTIAVVGASRDPGKIGAQIISNLIKSNFKGTLIPVNPKGEVIQGIQSIKNITEYPGTIDLVIIAIPQQFVEQLVDESIEKKVGSLVIITAGFKEVGDEGKVSEQRIKEKLLKANIPALGPNCLGIISPGHNMNASFAAEMPENGNIMFISQSGAFGTAAIDWASNHHIGFTYFISLGNKAVINENDFLQKVNENIKVIALYLEEISDGKSFMSLSQSIIQKVPILLLKPGKSEKAALAVKSHTGSLTGSDKVITVASKQSGILRVDTTEQLFNLTKAFSNLPELKGNRVAVITNAGGPGIITTDALETSGLELAPISKATQDELSKHLPREANIHDPIDLIGDAKADRYNHALKAVMNEQTVDACIVILTPQSSTEIELTAESIMAHVKLTSKPILAAFLGGTLVEEATATLTKNNIPCYTYPEQAVYVLSRMWEHTQNKEKIRNLPPIQNITHIGEAPQQAVIKKVQNAGRSILLQDEVEQFFKGTTVNFPLRIEVTSSQEAYQKALEIGTPVVMKVSSDKIVHKTEQHAVYLNLRDEAQIKESFTQLAALLKKNPSKDGSIYIQKQMPVGVEVLLGMKRDPTFGPVIVIGTGGTHTELYQDVASRIAPLTKTQAQEMLEETKIYQILKGYRGKDGFDTGPIIHAILSLANISLTYPEIQEIDINPLSVTDQGIIALDARILL